MEFCFSNCFSNCFSILETSFSILKNCTSRNSLRSRSRILQFREFSFSLDSRLFYSRCITSCNVCKWHILSATPSFRAKILSILPLYILKNLRKHLSAIYRQKYNLLFHPSIVKTLMTSYSKKNQREVPKRKKWTRT